MLQGVEATKILNTVGTSFSGLLTGRLYPPGLHCHSAAGSIKSTKNSNDTIGNRTRDLPACSAVPQLRHRASEVISFYRRVCVGFLVDKVAL